MIALYYHSLGTCNSSPIYYRNVIQVCQVSSLIIISIGIYTPYRHALTVAITWHCACTQVMVYIREVLTFVFRSWMREIGFMFFLKVWYLCVTHYNHCMYCIPGDFAKPSYIPLHHRNSRWDEILPLQKRPLWDLRIFEIKVSIRAGGKIGKISG